MTSNINKIAQGENKDSVFSEENLGSYQYGTIVVENHNNSKAIIIKKDGITITIGESIDICKNDKVIKVSNNLEIIASNITFKTPDGNLFFPNGLQNCLFTGSPHSFCQTIRGEKNE